MPRKAKSKKIPEIKIEDDVDEKMPGKIISKFVLSIMILVLIIA